MKSKKAKNAFHGVVLLLLCIGMLAGYYWIPLLGFLLEIAFWVYGLLFIKNEENEEEANTANDVKPNRN